MGSSGIMYLSIALILFMLGFGATHFTSEEVSTEVFISNLSSVENSTFDLLNKLPYTSMYNSSNINVGNIVSNIANLLVYPVVAGVNTIIPISVYAFRGEWGGTLINIILAIILLFVIFYIFQIIKIIICIYFFVKEKKKDKTKFWQ